MVGKYLIMATLFGSGGGSSGSGGGSAGVSPKEVNFYDYDGTCVHAYTVAEAQALSELPAGPEHPGLVFQGWNWSLEGVKDLTRAMNIGAMYTTDDGTTRLYITLQEGRTSPMLGVGVNGTVTVDWGDGTEPDVLTGTSVSTPQWTPNHAYAAPGAYVIRLTVDGEMGFTGSGDATQCACILRHASSSDKRNRTYWAAVQKVEIGSGVTKIGHYAFYNSPAFESITIPESVNTIESHAFHYCSSLRAIVFPKNIVTFNDFAVYQNSALKTAIVPENATEFYSNTFCANTVLQKFTFPNGITNVGYGMLTSCYALTTIVIPKSVTNIDYQAFKDCVGVVYYDFTACTSVPTLATTNAFSGISADCEIRVPAALYDEWIAATNWATYASQIKAY